MNYTKKKIMALRVAMYYLIKGHALDDNTAFMYTGGEELETIAARDAFGILGDMLEELENELRKDDKK